jgi:epoxyqueuosine reductase QueG
MTSKPEFLRAIKRQLDEFVLNSPENIVPDLGMMRIYDQPLLAVADAADALWATLQEDEVIGPQHLSPTTWLSEARSVICCFLPFTERVRSANRLQGWPAAEWLYGRYEGAVFSDAVCRFLVDKIQQAGGRAVAPCLDQQLAVVSLRSNWSERHAAFIAGLGTFSLSRSLITELGAAGRILSVICDLDLEPTPRTYTAVDEYCSQCGACIDRCPAQAIADTGKDNMICAQYLKQTKLRYQPRYGCGKCQTGVPCEAEIPTIAATDLPTA